mmetsp:Transcript_35947/g.103310  ORF Transcript_35947/g.103310 Transcript_35947/m.103310 type:complete len:226 (+) Transcript_35947:603-1280(+)
MHSAVLSSKRSWYVGPALTTSLHSPLAVAAESRGPGCGPQISATSTKVASLPYQRGRGPFFRRKSTTARWGGGGCTAGSASSAASGGTSASMQMQQSSRASEKTWRGPCVSALAGRCCSSSRLVAAQPRTSPIKNTSEQRMYPTPSGTDISCARPRARREAIPEMMTAKTTGTKSMRCEVRPRRAASSAISWLVIGGLESLMTARAMRERVSGTRAAILAKAGTP